MQIFIRKPRAVRLSIAEPCSQSWGEMTPVAGGRHCSACSATVTDFTAMTDRELFQWFKSGRTACGQFYEDQLERSIAAPREPKHSFWMKLGLGLMAFFGFAKEGNAQDKKVPPVVIVPLASAEESTSISAPETAQSEIKGTVTEEHNEGVPGVAVTIKDSIGRPIIVVVTDVNGEYSANVIVADFINCSVTFNTINGITTFNDVCVQRGKTTKIDYCIKPIPTAELRKRTMTVGRLGGEIILQPEGLHTVHKMKDRE